MLRSSMINRIILNYCRRKIDQWRMNYRIETWRLADLDINHLFTLFHNLINNLENLTNNYRKRIDRFNHLSEQSNKRM